MKTKIYKIIKNHKSSFPDPIIIKKGEKVSVGREYSEDPNWPNWIECESLEGKKGWVPKQCLSISSDTGTALCDYSANELNVKIGDEIIVYKLLNGWAWSQNSKGEYGWVPIKNISI